MFWTILGAAFAVLSAGLTLWQWWVAWRFPLHRRTPRAGSSAPGVTLLKPLKECDDQTEACLRSWFEQDYPGPVQLLFGVASETDPVCPVVARLLAAYPKANGELVICSKSLGPNAKVSTLAQLEVRAQHEKIVISDADVCAPADLLTHVTAPLDDPAVGLVNCFYRFAPTVTWAMRVEAVAVNADFWSQVLQSQSLKPLDFALGAVMATTRTQLAKVGGLGELVEFLADDFQLGCRINRGGARIVLCPVVVECRSAPVGWKDVWTHQLRWARTVRVCRPVPFFFSVLSNATFWPLLWLALDRTVLSLAGAVVFLSIRLLSARTNQQKLTREPVPWSHAGLVLLKDLASIVIWALAFFGDHVEWRGRRYRTLRDGRLAGPL